MPPITGIPTFNSAPINANPPSQTGDVGVTPQTAASQRRDQVSASTTATTTTATFSSSYPPPQPGPAAIPAPTAAVPSAYTPTQTYSISPSATAQERGSSGSSPPAPQPEARPTPGSTERHPRTELDSRPSKSSYSVPPPPKAGEPLQSPSYYAPKPTGALGEQPSSQHPVFQAASSSPSINQPLYSTPNSTSTPYMSTYQPRALNSNETPASLSQYRGSGSLLAGDEADGSLFGQGGQGILDTAKSWMQTAGTKLAEAEEEVWKRVNSKS